MLTVTNEMGACVAPPSLGGTAEPVDVEALRQRCAFLELENARLLAAMKELERIAERDTLTPLFNRRHFLATMKKWLAALSVGETRGAVVFMDVNQLKGINDRFGHAAGDFALMEIAARMERFVSDSEIAARIGGDEFGFLLNVKSMEDAEAQVAAMSDALTEAPAIFESRPIPLSACFGIAMLRGGESGVSILAKADHDMYRAKYGVDEPLLASA